MHKNTIYILLLSFVQFTYKPTVSLNDVRKDIVDNQYFGDDTDLVLSELDNVWQTLVELGL